MQFVMLDSFIICSIGDFNFIPMRLHLYCYCVYGKCGIYPCECDVFTSCQCFAKFQKPVTFCKILKRFQ